MDEFVRAHPLLAMFVAGAGVVAAVLLVLDLADRWRRCARCGHRQTHHPPYGEPSCECLPKGTER